MYFQTDHEKRVGIKINNKKTTTRSHCAVQKTTSVHVKVESRGAKVTESMA